MPSELELSALEDIQENIQRAQSFVAGMTEAEFRQDIKTFYAVTRCLEIVSEASRRLSPELKERHPHVQWKAAAGSGNIYRHDYENVMERMVWRTVHLSLPPLLEVVKAELAK